MANRTLPLSLSGKLLLPIFLTVIISCKEVQHQYHANKLPIKKEMADFFVTKVDSVVIPVKESSLKKVIAGKPKTILLHNHIQPASLPKIVLFNSFSFLQPGKGKFLLPEKIPASGNHVFLNEPEPFIAKEMTFGIPDPSSFALFDKMQGLKSGIVTCLLNDKEGNIWICTSGGVSKYDGHSFTNFTTSEGLIDNDVRSILQDRKGNIWFGTLKKGLSMYDGYSFTNYTEKNGLNNNAVVGLTEDDNGNIWIATYGGGVSKFNGQYFENFSHKQGLVDDSVNCILKDKSGNLWLGTCEGISKYDGSSFTNYIFPETRYNNTISMLQDKNGKLWLGTYGGGLLCLEKNAFYRYSTAEGLTDNDVFSLLQSRDGHIWIGTHNGLSEFDGTSFKNFKEEDGLSNSNIYSLMQDAPGNIWIGTGGGGLLKYIPNSFNHLTASEGLPKNFIFSLYNDYTGNLWFGSWRGGVTKYDGYTLKTFSDSDGLPANDIRSITQDKKGNFWFATYKGVAKYNGKFFIWLTEKDGLVNDDVNDIFIDKDGNLWFGTEKGVSKYDGSKFVNFLYGDKKVIAVNLICQSSDGYILICTSNGLYRYENKNFYMLSKMTDTPVNTVIEDSTGNLWIGASNGLFSYDKKHLVSLTENSGLVNNDVIGILQDHLGNTWFSTRFGLSKLTPHKNILLRKRVQEGKQLEEDVFFKNYRYEDGYLGIGGSKQAILETKNNTVWSATNKGVTFFNPSKEIADTNPIHTVITSVKISGQMINWNSLVQNKDSIVQLKDGTRLMKYQFDSISRWSHLPGNLCLGHYNNNISFDFEGTTTNQPEDIKYRYQLEGFDKYANALTNQSTVSYGNLPPGHYTFKVSALNSDGVWGTEASFPFAIRTAWWKTGWFIFFLSVVFLVLLFFVIRFIYGYQLRKQKLFLEKQMAVQYERQRISSDLHDEIGSTLSSINIYSNLAKSEKEKEAYLDAIAANVNEVVSKLDDLVWKINPKYDTLGSVIQRLMFYIEPLAAAKNILLDVRDSEPLRSQKLDAETKHQLFLVLKELLNNSVKHSGCKILKIEFTVYKSLLQVMLTDDGKGFEEPQVPSHRNGMNIIRQRVYKMHWQLTIKTATGEGCKTTILLPLA